MAPDSNKSARVVIAHDYFTQHGGAERVALELARQLRAERIVTAAYRPEQTFSESRDFAVEELDYALLRPFASDPRRALPFLAPAWSAAPPVEAEALICSTSGWSHGLRVADGTRKIVYCHNPARWLYQREDYVRGMSPLIKAALSVLSPGLRRWDRRAARSADVYLANSTVVAQRIRNTYGIDAEVVHPPVSIDTAGPQAKVDGVDAGYFLTVARPRGYKGTETLVEAFRQMPKAQLVVVGASLPSPLPANVTSLGEVTEPQLRWLYENAQALTSVSHEDFGLTPLEANSFGTPALVLRSGGFLDSTSEGVSGSFIDTDTVSDVISAVKNFTQEWDVPAIRRHAATFSPETFGRRIRAIVGISDAGSSASGARAVA